MSTEQKPETEARTEQIAAEWQPSWHVKDSVIWCGACGDPMHLDRECTKCGHCGQDYGLSAKDANQSDITVLTVHYESIIAAKEAEIQRLKACINSGRSAHNEDRVRADTLWRERDDARDQLKAQTALLVEACLLSNAITESCEGRLPADSSDSVTLEAVHVRRLLLFLSRPEVAALLAGKEKA